MLGHAAGHSGAAGSIPRKDVGMSRTFVKAKPQIRQGLTNLIPVDIGQVQCHIAGHNLQGCRMRSW